MQDSENNLGYEDQYSEFWTNYMDYSLRDFYNLGYNDSIAQAMYFLDSMHNRLIDVPVNDGITVGDVVGVVRNALQKHMLGENASSE